MDLTEQQAAVATTSTAAAQIPAYSADLEAPRARRSSPAWMRHSTIAEEGEGEELIPRTASAGGHANTTGQWTASSIANLFNRPSTPVIDNRPSSAHALMEPPTLQPIPVRKTSEAVAIDRLFESLGVADGASPIPTGSAMGALGSSPLIKQQQDDEEIFQGDLASVLVWFEKNLSPSQRITTAFALFERMTQWQRDFVLGMLKTTEMTASVRSQTEDILGLPKEVQNRSPSPRQATPSPLPPRPRQPSFNSPPPGFGLPSGASPLPSIPLPQISATPPPDRTPSPSFNAPRPASPAFGPRMNQPTRSFSPRPASPHRSVTSPAPSVTTSMGGELTYEMCYPELFKRDVPQWLRSLRLHKYTPAIGRLTQAELFAIDDVQMEQMGVAALGARRKLLRVLAIIKEHQA